MTETVKFQKWPSILRERNLFIVAEEKIDGTNAALHIRDGEVVGVQSRKRIIHIGDDNFGFACWAYANSEILGSALGDGIHFGEWWGSGIQRGYGLTNGERRFSLFNSLRWSSAKDHFESLGIGLSVVPQLHAGKLGEYGFEGLRDYAIALLRANGSWAAPGFDRPEGAILFIPDFDARIKVIPEGWEPKSKKATRG